MRPPLTARALLLDMDGTLVNSDAVVERCWRRWAAGRGWTRTPCSRWSTAARGTPPWPSLLPDRPDGAEPTPTTGGCSHEETADLDGVVPIAGAPAFMAALAGCRTPWSTSADDGSRPGPDGRGRTADAGRPGHRGARRREQAGPGGLPQGRGRTGLRAGGLRGLRGLRGGIAAGRAAGMRVVGVGPRAAAHAPDAHVRDLAQVRAEALPGKDGLRLHLAG